MRVDILDMKCGVCRGMIKSQIHIYKTASALQRNYTTPASSRNSAVAGRLL
jgi:hypothetical protein